MSARDLSAALAGALGGPRKPATPTSAVPVEPSGREFGAPVDGWCVRRWVPGVLVPPGERPTVAWSRGCQYRGGRRVWQGPKRRTSREAWADVSAAQVADGAASSDPEPDHPDRAPPGGEIVSSQT